MKSILMAPLGLLLAGCVPWPHAEYIAPQMSVIVQSGGHPVENAEVRLSARGTDEIHAGRTDASGRVTLPALKDFEFFAVLMGDRFFFYQVQIKVGGQTYDGFGAPGIGSIPSDIGTVFCDLAKPIGQGEGRQYCDDGRRVW